MASAILFGWKNPNHYSTVIPTGLIILTNGKHPKRQAFQVVHG